MTELFFIDPLDSSGLVKESVAITVKEEATPSYVMSPYPTVVMVTTAHQKPSGMDLKCECGEPASAK
jgi:hypothetical protein